MNAWADEWFNRLFSWKTEYLSQQKEFAISFPTNPLAWHKCVCKAIKHSAEINTFCHILRVIIHKSLCHSLTPSHTEIVFWINNNHLRGLVANICRLVQCDSPRWTEWIATQGGSLIERELSWLSSDGLWELRWDELGWAFTHITNNIWRERRDWSVSGQRVLGKFVVMFLLAGYR